MYIVAGRHTSAAYDTFAVIAYNRGAQVVYNRFCFSALISVFLYTEVVAECLKLTVSASDTGGTLLVVV